MTNEELEQYLNKLEAKIDRLSNLEDRLESCWKGTEKFKANMINKGYSYDMIQEFVKATQPVQQYINTIRNLRKKAEKAQQEIDARKKEAEIAKQAETVAKKFPYNVECTNFSLVNGQVYCDVKMDMIFCSHNCPYCTTRTGSYVVNGKGNVVGTRKYAVKKTTRVWRAN